MLEALAVAAVVFAAALVGGISGFGFGLVCVPPLSLILGPANAVVLTNLVSPLQGLGMFLLLRRHVRGPTATRLVIAAAFGLPVGVVALVVLPADALRSAIAATVLLGTFTIWRGYRLPVSGRAAELSAGFVSGVLKTSTSINGPPIVLYLQGTGIEPLPFRATMAAFFLFSSTLAIAVLVGSAQVDGRLALLSLLSLPGLAAGILAGNRVFGRLDPDRFRGVVLGLLVVSACVVLVSAAVL